MGDNDEFIAEFLEECDENLDQLDQDLVALEDDPRDPERLKSIFRNIHTIKGSSGFFGFVKLGALAHDGENLLGKVRDGELLFDQSIASGLLKMVDAVREIMSRIEQDGREGDRVYPEVLEELQRLLTAQQEAAVESPAVPPSPADEDEDDADEDDEDEDDADEDEDDEDDADDDDADEDDADEDDASTQQAAASQADNAEADTGPPSDTPAVPAAAPSPEPVESASASSSPPRPQADASSIRVDVGLLDELMDFAGELVLARNALSQCSGVAENPDLAAVTGRVSQITSEIQDRVMRTRMQPIGAIWSKFRRIVRDLSVSCGKQVRLELEGEETELDRSLLEAIRDPLTHIVRNSVDHGIEHPDERVAAGKPREGVLHLRARHESGQVVIEAIDDGGGIDVETIREKAITRGLLSERAAASASDAHVLACIFEPGFSTAKQVSAISGRGVGMDVVKSHIERIGGSVELQSKLGQGTKLIIRIPLTLAIIPALMVGSGGQRFVIPQASVLEVITAGLTSPIERLHNVPVYRLRDRLLPLIWLDELLEIDSLRPEPTEPAEEDEAAGVSVAVLQVDGRRFGLVIDEVLNTLEIVVKPMGASIKSIAAFSAATILGDGSVAMILDVSGICRLGGLAGDTVDRPSQAAVEGEPELDQDAAVADSPGRQRTLLVCDVGGGREVAIPLEMIERLEEVAVSEIKLSDSGLAANYRGTVLPIVLLGDWLSKLLTDSPPIGGEAIERVHVVVHRRADQLVGAAVQRIVDVVQGNSVVELAASDPSRSGVMGMTLAGGRMLEVVDLERI